VKILVPIKRVADPDNANKVKVAPDGSSVTSEGLEWKLNPFDEWSLEAALRLTENAAEKSRVGEVVVVTIGPKDATQTIRQGLAMGAERAIRVEGDDAQLDAWQVASVLAAVAKKEQPDLIIMGKQVVDGDSNVVPQYLAELLGWPALNYAQSLTTDAEGKTVKAQRELDTGVETLEVDGPAVITCADRILHPQAVKNGVTPDDFTYPAIEGGRYATLKGIMKAKRKPIDETTVGDLGVEAAATVQYTAFELPPARSGNTTFVESVEELVEKLHADAKVL